MHVTNNTNYKTTRVTDNNSSKDGVRKVECHKVTIPSIVEKRND